MRNCGPIQGYQQYVLGEALGPFMTIGSILQLQQWAHMRPMAAFLQSNVGPFKAIGNISNIGPIHDHWQYSSVATVGPYETIASISLEKPWAHSRLSAACLGRGTGPIPDHW